MGAISHWGTGELRGELRFCGAANAAFGALSFANGFACAVRLQDDEAPATISRFELSKLKKNIKNVVALSEAVLTFGRAYLRAPEDDSDTNALVALTITNQCVEAIRDFLPTRDHLMKLDPQIEKAWPQESQNVLVETLDFLENMQETLALGLSEAFQEDINTVRAEVGAIARPAKNGVSTD